MLVRDLDAHGRLARDRRHDPDAHGLQAQRQVVRQRHDPVDLDPRPRLQLVARDHGAGVDRGDAPLHAELQQLLLQKPGILRHLLLVWPARPAAGIQELRRRPGKSQAGGQEIEGLLLLRRLRLARRRAPGGGDPSRPAAASPVPSPRADRCRRPGRAGRKPESRAAWPAGGAAAARGALAWHRQAPLVAARPGPARRTASRRSESGNAPRGRGPPGPGRSRPAPPARTSPGSSQQANSSSPEAAGPVDATARQNAEVSRLARRLTTGGESHAQPPPPRWARGVPPTRFQPQQKERGRDQQGREPEQAQQIAPPPRPQPADGVADLPVGRPRDR